MSKLNADKNNTLKSEYYRKRVHWCLAMFVVCLFMIIPSFLLINSLFLPSVSEFNFILVIGLLTVFWLSLGFAALKVGSGFFEMYENEKTEELRFREILENLPGLELFQYEEWEPLREKSLISCCAFFQTDFFDGKSDIYGDNYISGDYHGKDFEMADAHLQFTNNSAGQPTYKLYDGIMIVLESDMHGKSCIQYMFRKNDDTTIHTAEYKRYLLVRAKLKKVKPVIVDGRWESYSNDPEEADNFINSYSDWLASVTDNIERIHFIIRHNSHVVVGIGDRLLTKEMDVQKARDAFESTVSKILKYCVEPFEKNNKDDQRSINE